MKKGADFISKRAVGDL